MSLKNAPTYDVLLNTNEVSASIGDVSNSKSFSDENLVSSIVKLNAHCNRKLFIAMEPVPNQANIAIKEVEHNVFFLHVFAHDTNGYNFQSIICCFKQNFKDSVQNCENLGYIFFLSD